MRIRVNLLRSLPEVNLFTNARCVTILRKIQAQRSIYERGDDIKAFESNDEAIKNFKKHIKGLKNEWKSLREEERVLARGLDLMNQSLKVVVKIPDQVLQGLQLEKEEIEEKPKAPLQGETQDAFNQLTISTEEKIRNLFELKNKLLDIMFLKRSYMDSFN